jgi:hypothetical protein
LLFRIGIEAVSANTLATLDSLDFDLANAKHAELSPCQN